MKRGRKPKIDWELYRPQIEELRSQGKSLNQVCAILYEKLGTTVTAARLSQVLTKWKDGAGVVIKPTDEGEMFFREGTNAN